MPRITELSLTRRDFGPIIHVLVGEEDAQHKYEIHKGLLVYYSAYFRNVLKDPWAEGTNKTVKLSGEYQDAFDIFYQRLFLMRFHGIFEL
jgi:hypothetical protein